MRWAPVAVVSGAPPARALRQAQPPASRPRGCRPSAASVIDACSMSGTSTGSLLKNLMTHCSTPISMSAFGFAPPKLPPAFSIWRSTSLTGALALTLCTTSLSAVPGPAAAAGFWSRGTYAACRCRHAQRAEAVVARVVQVLHERQARGLVEVLDDPLAPAVGPRIVDGADAMPFQRGSCSMSVSNRSSLKGKPAASHSAAVLQRDALAGVDRAAIDRRGAVGRDQPGTTDTGRRASCDFDPASLCPRALALRLALLIFACAVARTRSLPSVSAWRTSSSSAPRSSLGVARVPSAASRPISQSAVASTPRLTLGSPAFKSQQGRDTHPEAFRPGLERLPAAQAGDREVCPQPRQGRQSRWGHLGEGG